MERKENLLIIGGTGRDAGKSSLAELLLRRFAGRAVTGIKITPHSHPDLSGLTLLAGDTGFQIYEESNRVSEKDSSRMLRAGASKVFLVVSGASSVAEAFIRLQPLLMPGAPVLCESPALRRIVHPDLFILMKHTSGASHGKKNIDDLIPLADLTLTIDDLGSGRADIIDLDNDNKWYLKL